MIVSVRSRGRKSDLDVHIGSSLASIPHKLQVDKGKLDSCIQMLHHGESSVLAKSTGAMLQITSLGNNEFTLNMHTLEDCSCACSATVSSTKCSVEYTQSFAFHPSVQVLLRYAQRQVVPVYATASAVSKRMQDTFGSVLMETPAMENCFSGADNTFMRSNACTVSKLADILNCANCGRTFSPSFAARLAMLAATFSASAPSSKTGNLFHVSQLQMTDCPTSMMEHVSAKPPEKQHVTILMRGDDANDRIKRFNVAVRIFRKDSEFVREHLPKMTGMNCTMFSDVMLFSGIRNHQAAAIFLSSETLSVNSHSAALNFFKGA